MKLTGKDEVTVNNKKIKPTDNKIKNICIKGDVTKNHVTLVITNNSKDELFMRKMIKDFLKNEKIYLNVNDKNLQVNNIHVLYDNPASNFILFFK
jgi:hypothetical protein